MVEQGEQKFNVNLNFQVGELVEVLGDSTSGNYTKGDTGIITKQKDRNGYPVVKWDHQPSDTKGCKSGLRRRRTVSILHLSDTHNLHDTIPNMPSADVLIHTGDWTENGTDDEHDKFNVWLGKIKANYKDIVVISGNHEWPTKGMTANPGMLRNACDPRTYLRRLLTNATVLEHELVTVCGLKIFGSSWVPWVGGANPDEESPSKKDALEAARAADRTVGTPTRQPRFGEIQECDVLMTHGPPRGLLSNDWGSSQKLRKVIEATPPLVHCFGHLHEQRGFWQRNESGWGGCIEYQGEGAGTWQLPKIPDDSRMQLISCNAMKHQTKENIEGGGRLIYAVPEAGIHRWRFVF
jgi:Icc-related predicted phosphoesterase